MEEAPTKETLLAFRRAASVTGEHARRPSCMAFYSKRRRARVRLTFNYKIGWFTNRLVGALCLKPDTCVPLTDLSPQAILKAEGS